jgi:DNA-directed RNA polymerase subunit RPC12/RpoP
VKKKVYLILIFEISSQRPNIMQTEGDLSNPDEGDCSVKTHEKDFTCEHCGKTFQKPILATISISGQKQTYYACPRCMTRVQSFKASIREKKEKSTALTTEPNEPKKEPESVEKCAHFFGYLNKREKNTPFPDECLTCTRTVECLLH